jgi:hypothetical protein
MNSKFLTLVFLVSACFCGRSTVQVLDDWQTLSDSLLIIVDRTTLPSTQELFTISTTGNIVGQERDLELRVVDGDDDAIISISASLALSLATPTNANGGFLLQYDGEDRSMNLNPTGLSHLDLTAFGADAIEIHAATDHPVNAVITVSSDANRISTFVLSILPSDEIVRYEIFFADFLGNADFTDVGSISIEIAVDINIDVVITLLGVSGPDRIFFINPTRDIVYNFKEQCSENKKATLAETSSTTESSSTTHSDTLGKFSISLVFEQYFSFTWNLNIDEETKEVDFIVTSDFSQMESSASIAGASVLAIVFVFLL